MEYRDVKGNLLSIGDSVVYTASLYITSHKPGLKFLTIDRMTDKNIIFNEGSRTDRPHQTVLLLESVNDVSTSDLHKKHLEKLISLKKDAGQKYLHALNKDYNLNVIEEYHQKVVMYSKLIDKLNESVKMYNEAVNLEL